MDKKPDTISADLYHSRANNPDNTSPLSPAQWEDWHKRVQDKYDRLKKK